MINRRIGKHIEIIINKGISFYFVKEKPVKDPDVISLSIISSELNLQNRRRIIRKFQSLNFVGQKI